MATKSITAKFSREKETANTVKFQEDAPKGEAPVIGTLYLQKFAAEKLGGDVSEVIVTVEVT